MKFVGLALALLLAAGCQADAPTSYEHIKAVGATYINQAKQTAQKAIDQLDDAEFKDYKVRLNKGMQTIENFITHITASIDPVGPQIFEFLSSTREHIVKDFEALHKELEPKCQELRAVLKTHFEEYRALLEPSLKEYSEKNSQVVEEFRTKFEPVVKELKEKIKVNLEETKSKLTPIVEIIRNKLIKVLEQLKATYGPHIQEYREQFDIVIDDLRKKYESGELQEKIKNLIDELRPKLLDIYHTIEKAFKS
ncbi:apolipoprotein A-I-1-like [Hemibagrus wyckioides]|nr:apolipoprotein A-I-1-like [Hemibagrus wyckioides]